jgi:hypothetical protein
MIRPFCQQEVDSPCRNTVEMQQQANGHIERCNSALKSLQSIVFG